MYQSSVFNPVVIVFMHTDTHPQEYETKFKECKPGVLTDGLKAALGMPTGPVC